MYSTATIYHTTSRKPHTVNTAHIFAPIVFNQPYSDLNRPHISKEKERGEKKERSWSRLEGEPHPLSRWRSPFVGGQVLCPEME
jgi:hypothetical protein